MTTSGIEVAENVYDRYLRKAKFRRESETITDLFRFYTHEATFTTNSSFITTGFVVLSYKAKHLLYPQRASCFSEYKDNEFFDEVISSSMCFENSDFQLVVGYGVKPESNIQFVLHVSNEVFNAFKKGCLPQAYGHDDKFEESSLFFDLEFFGGRQLNNQVLTLKQSVLLSLLIRLYQHGSGFLNEFVQFAMSTANTTKVFDELSKYVFTNFFELSTEHFQSSLDCMYSILFTCIALSDSNFVQHTPICGTNGTMMTTILYFKSIFHMVCNSWNCKKDRFR